MSGELVISKRLPIGAAPGTVWRVLTDPVQIEQWLGTRVDSNWHVGEPIVFRFSWEGKSFEDKGTILQLIPEKVFSYSYWSAFSGLPDRPENYSVVTFDLSTQGEQTVLRLRHEQLATQTMYEHSDKNWEETLATIKKLAEDVWRT